MQLVKIKIEGLFDLFSYEIDFNQKEHLTILTGPNGYGKTTVLTILYNLFNYRFYYFQRLVFNKIEIHFTDQSRLEVKKIILPTTPENQTKIPNGNGIIDEKQHDGNSKIVINLYDRKNLNLGKTFEYTPDLEEGIKNKINNHLPPSFNKISSNQWINEEAKRITNFEDLLTEYTHIFLESVNESLSGLFNSSPVYLIRDQRLVKRRSFLNKRITEQKESYVSTIQEYAEILSLLIRNKQIESLQITQQLDSTFPKRLLDSKNKLSEQEFLTRFEVLKKKFEKLQKFGLLTTTLDIPLYNDNAENAKVLTIYLEDSEKKTAVFDELLNKIDLFTTILNQKRFTFKSIQIDKDNGFLFKTNKGQTLSLTDLSSGEQHEVVLLFELLFQVKPNTLVLIDEPEISLHVSWQHAFINDLIKIAEMQKIRFVIATHSPMIINNRFDLSVDLFALTQPTK
jgi:predicted ATP-binding protein involved in virulence